MAVTIDGTTGVSAVQAGAVESADLPVGSVIQVVSATTNTEINSTSSSFVDSGLSATITPLSSNSKIMIVVSLTLTSERDAFHVATLRVVRGSSEIFKSTRALGQAEPTPLRALVPIVFLDSPNTASAITYKVQGKPEFPGSNARLQFQEGNSDSSITLMEIAG